MSKIENILKQPTDEVRGCEKLDKKLIYQALWGKSSQQLRLTSDERIHLIRRYTFCMNYVEELELLIEINGNGNF